MSHTTSYALPVVQKRPRWCPTIHGLPHPGLGVFLTRSDAIERAQRELMQGQTSLAGAVRVWVAFEAK